MSSVVDDVLTILFDYSAGYKRLRQLAHRGSTRPRFIYPLKASFRKIPKRIISDSSLRATLCRMRKNGLVQKRGDIWEITVEGVSFYEKRQIFQKRSELTRLNRKKSKTMIIAFDVPEFKRYSRDWLREELLVLGFEPIQKSVWFGPAPLPESFILEIAKKNISSYLKFFKVAKEELF